MHTTARCRKGVCILPAWGLLVAFIVLSGAAISSESISIAELTLVPASETVPYAYWYYVPACAAMGETLGIVWHATPGGSEPDDAGFWARFDLPQFLACKSAGWPQRTVNLPDLFGLALVSVAVPAPPQTFYAGREGDPLGQPTSLSSLGVFERLDAPMLYHNPDLKALASIDDFRRRLGDAGLRFDPRIFLTGVYSGAEWAHRFALLHPEEVRAVAPVCGNVYTLPLTHLEDDPLLWPLGISGWHETGRAPFNRERFLELRYLLTASWHERVWYNEMTPAEQGVDLEELVRYVNALGTIPPVRAASFAERLFDAGVDGRLVWSDGGHGWVDSARYRVFEFFSRFPLIPGVAP